jgi:uncharacterized protein (DUF362 family)
LLFALEVLFNRIQFDIITLRGIFISQVSFGQIRKHTLVESITHSLDLIKYKFPTEAKNIVIKPNMCYYWHHSTGQTTDPAFVGALIDVLRQNVKTNPKISIVESDASAMKCKHAFKFLGYDKLSSKYNVDLINLSDERFTVVQAKSNGISFPLMVPDIIQNADLRINVPKLKYSTKKLGITCAMKNLYGCNPYPKKYKLHPNLGEAIVAINKAMPFNLCLLDGNIVSGVKTSRLGLMMASQDPVAFDAAASKIAGFNPDKLEYLKLAEKEGLGTTAFVERGVRLSYFRCLYPKASIKTRLKGKAINLLVQTGLSSRLGL